jgi:diguanylate cyclase (GGDEF)-like protein
VKAQTPGTESGHTRLRGLLAIAYAVAMGLLLFEAFVVIPTGTLPEVVSIGVSCGVMLAAVPLLLSLDKWANGRTMAGLVLMALGIAVGLLTPDRVEAAAILPLAGAVLTLPEHRGKRLAAMFGLALTAGIVATSAASLHDALAHGNGVASWAQSLIESAAVLTFAYGLVWRIGEHWQSATERAQHALTIQRQLLEVTERLLSTLDVQGVLDLMVDSLKPLLAYDNLTIYQVDREAGVLRPMVTRDRFEQAIMNMTFPLDTGITGWVVEHGEAQCVNDVDRDERAATIPGTPDEPESLIVVPLTVGGKVAGTLNVGRNGKAEARFSADEFELARLFAAHASIALQNAEAHLAVWNRAETDSLTRLHNRGALDSRLESLVQEGARRYCALIMVDLDGFKMYNDRHGHPAGDTVLQAVGRAIDSAIRERDLSFRYGGDEFAVVLPRTGVAQAVQVADRIRHAIKEHPIVAGTLTASAGVACHPIHAADRSALISAADAALYRAKQAGGNCTEVYSRHPSRQRRRRPTSGRGADLAPARVGAAAAALEDGEEAPSRRPHSGSAHGLGLLPTPRRQVRPAQAPPA